MSAAVLTVLCLALVAALGWWLGTLIAVWNTRPVTMFDHKTGRWRAHNLIGTPWRTKHHDYVCGHCGQVSASRSQCTACGTLTGTLERRPLEQAPWNDPLLLTQSLDKTA